MLTLPAHFVALARNNRWSNFRLLRSVACLTDEEYFAERPSFFGSIHATLNHLLVVDLLYYARLTGGTSLSTAEEAEHDQLASLRDAQLASDRRLQGFCEDQTDASLSSKVSFNRADGSAYVETVAAVLMHLFVHQVHHRGQVHDMLSATSVAPPQLDEFFMSGDLGYRRNELEHLGLPIE